MRHETLTGTPGCWNAPEAARELLLKSTDPVKTIAAACGYPTLQNFYRHFKRRYGTSPQSTSH